MIKQRSRDPSKKITQMPRRPTGANHKPEEHIEEEAAEVITMVSSGAITEDVGLLEVSSEAITEAQTELEAEVPHIVEQEEDTAIKELKSHNINLMMRVKSAMDQSHSPLTR